MVRLVQDEQAELPEERIERGQLPTSQRLDHCDRHGRHARLAGPDEPGLDAQLVAQLAKPLLGEVERMHQHQRGRAQSRYRPHPDAGLPSATGDDDSPLRHGSEPIDCGLLVVPQRQLGHGRQRGIRQHAGVVTRDEDPVLRRSPAQCVDRSAWQDHAAGKLLDEAQRLRLGSPIQAEAQAVEIGGVRKRQRPDQPLEEPRG